MTKELLKKWLKLIKEYEESASMIIGFLIVVALSGFVFYVMKNLSHLWISSENNQIQNDIEIGENIIPQISPVEINASEFTVIDPDLLSTHLVEPGEGLWQIAVKYYGDGNQYIKIYEANKDKMKSPEDISVGMELRIP